MCLYLNHCQDAYRVSHQDFGPRSAFLSPKEKDSPIKISSRVFSFLKCQDTVLDSPDNASV